MNFSNRLVELRLRSLVLGPDSKLVGLLQALKSASELRDLKLISIITFPDSTISWNSLSGRFSFPKLETLLLQDSNFTALKLLPTCRQIHLPDDEPENPNIEEIYALLRRVEVNALILKGDSIDDSWLDSAGLRSLLKSLPALRTLKITHWDLPENNLPALKRPRGGRKGPSQSFSNFNDLHLVDVQLWETKALKQLVSSHSLQKMELSGIYIKEVPIDEETDSEVQEWDEFTEDFRSVKWLKNTVPQFRLARNIHETDDHDFQQDVWRLW
ncbi:unnamed protein product [Rhizoctonia solani]|uniref:Uncharacterized protein n=1 Tax=Rhizoctonia solani TaxID=456999 RepID=A0A8H3CK18_9AGAM|nr:unnamed protein product [Rhizoctonia solani]